MAARAETRELRRHLPHALVATFAVSILPLILVSLEPLNGLPGSVTLALSVALSIAASWAGTVLWVKKFGSGDLVFGDLMLWGWLRRLATERRLASITGRLAIDSVDARGRSISPQQQTKILKQLAASLEARDPYTHGHSRRVTRHSYMIAKALGLPKNEIETIRVAASLHDVGKLNIPLSVLHKTGKLTDEEFEIISQHAGIGANMVAAIGNSELTAIVRHHHERVDGTGYPDRLAGDAIPLGAKIIAVADTFDAITSTRSYRRAAKHSRAIGILKLEAGHQLDRKVVETFLGYYSGRNAIEWWAAVTTLPQRVWVMLSSWIRNAGGPALLQGAAAVGTVAIVGGMIAPAGSIGELPVLGRARDAIAGYIGGEAIPASATSDQTETGPAQVAPLGPGNTGGFTGITVGLPGSPAVTTSPEGEPVVDGAPPESSTANAPNDQDLADPASGTSTGTATNSSDGTGEVPVASGDGTTKNDGTKGSNSTTTDPVTDAVAPVTDAVAPVTDTVGGTIGSAPTTGDVTDGVSDVTDPVTGVVDDTVGSIKDGPLL